VCLSAANTHDSMLLEVMVDAVAPVKGPQSSQRLGRHRHVVERSLAWLVGYRRLQVRYERRADILLAFLHLACALICLKSLTRPTA
jgi:transposase